MSGGGFRAALYHFGCMKRLHELGLLGWVNGISATSGGSFVAAFWAKALKAKNKDPQKFWDQFEHDFIRIMMQGVLGPTTLLIFSYGLYILSAFLWLGGFRSTGFYGFTLGILTHLCLAGVLIRDKVHKLLSYEEALAKIGKPITPGFRRFLLMMFLPSETRWQTMNVRAFQGIPLSQLSLVHPPIYFVAVNLNSGMQEVFSPKVVSDLTKQGCRDLWTQKATYGQSTDRLPLSKAIAASTAIPPWFRPVCIDEPNRPVGCYIDGGVVDNAALNVPRNLSIYIHPRIETILPGFLEGLGKPTFDKTVGYVFGIDASARIPKIDQRRWSRLDGIKRLHHLILNQQRESVDATAWSLNLHRNIESPLLTLQNGFDPSSELYDRLLNTYIESVRTNVDSFSIHECAAIAYCGYSAVEYWFKGNKKHFDDRIAINSAPFRQFKDFFPAQLPPYFTSVQELTHHLRHSGSAFAAVRWLRRLV
jgi:Patatin-like phospholipase